MYIGLTAALIVFGCILTVIHLYNGDFVDRYGLASIKIAISFLQVISLLLLIDLDWPDYMHTYNLVFKGAISLNVHYFYLECYIDEGSHFNTEAFNMKIFLSALLPLLFLSLSLLITLIRWVFRRNVEVFVGTLISSFMI